MRFKLGVALACIAALGAAGCDDLLGIDNFTPDAASSTTTGNGGSGGADTKLQVFITSTLHDGALGPDSEPAIDNADAICTKRALAANLTGRLWTAWLTNQFRIGMTAALGPHGPWHLVDGTPAIASYDDLVACQPCLAAAINLNEFGASADDAPVWTGTNVDGSTISLDSLDNTCLGWSSNDAGQVGAVGSPADTSAAWTHANDAACNTPAHLYCFELP